jgi:hypothetical protein
MIDAYHRLLDIEKSFWMAYSDLQARPVYHCKRDSIEAHLTIVFAALAVGHRIEASTVWSIKKFVRTTPPLSHYHHPGRPPPSSSSSSPPTPCPTTSEQPLTKISNASPGAH